MMPTAYSILPDRFEDGRHKAMEAGLQAVGYRLVHGYGAPKSERDVLITWTRHRGGKETQCAAFEEAGGRVIVAEEAYIRVINGEKYYAAALHDHNGAGEWPQGGPERWASWGLELKPWRDGGEYILVAGQRGIGSAKMHSPPGWHDRTAAKLRGLTDVEVRIRRHPKERGVEPPTTTLDEDLAGASAVCVWSSSVGVKALMEGIPTFYSAPAMSVMGAAENDLEHVICPTYPDRLPAFERMAWGQWNKAEYESGAAFAALLHGELPS